MIIRVLYSTEMTSGGNFYPAWQPHVIAAPASDVAGLSFTVRVDEWDGKNWSTKIDRTHESQFNVPAGVIAELEGLDAADVGQPVETASEDDQGDETDPGDSVPAKPGKRRSKGL